MSVQRCEAHGMAYDPETSDGCVVCRRERGEKTASIPASAAKKKPSSLRVALSAGFLGALTIAVYDVHKELNPEPPALVVEGSAISSAPLGFHLDLPPGWFVKPPRTPEELQAIQPETGNFLVAVASLTSPGGDPDYDLKPELWLKRGHVDGATVSGESHVPCTLGSASAVCTNYSLKVEGVSANFHVFLLQKGHFVGGRTYTLFFGCGGPDGGPSACDDVLARVVLPA